MEIGIIALLALGGLACGLGLCLPPFPGFTAAQTPFLPFGFLPPSWCCLATAVFFAVAGLLSSLLRQRPLKKTIDQLSTTYQAIFDHSGIATVIVEADTTISRANKEFAQMTGYAREDLEGRKSWTEFVHPGDLDRLLSYDRQSRVDPRAAPNRYEFRLINRSGEIREIAINVTHIADTQQTVGFLLDITSQKMEAKALVDSKDRFQALVETTSDWIWEIDAHDRYTYASPKVKDLMGYEPEEVIGKQPYDFMPPAEGERLAALFATIKEARWPFAGLENLNRCKDGRQVVLETSGVPILAPDGRLLGYRGIDRDLTSRKLMEEALRNEKARYQAIVQALEGFIYIFSEDYTLEFMNNRAYEYHGRYPLGEQCHRILYRREERCPWCRLEAALAGDTGHVELLNPLDQRWYQIVFTPVTYGGGRRAAMVIHQDVTERKKLEEEVIKTCKLESLSIFAGGLAHDFNNILTAILGNINLMRLQEGLPAELQDRLTDAERACIRASGLTQQLLTFAKGGAPVKTLASLPDLLRESAGFVLSGSRVRSDFFLPPDIWPTEVDPGQISQVFNNLFINAMQAMPEGGVIKIAAENLALPENEPDTPLPPGRYVKIAVKDQGLGIPEKHLPKIFDPFFSTKQKGNGLGLTTTYSIVKKHLGLIRVESALGQGSTFYLYFPAAHPKTVLESNQDEIVLTGRGRILVMDDEPTILQMLGLMLEKLGYEAEFAADGAEALKLYEVARDRGQPFDAVIMDLTIPGGMGGREAVHMLRRLDPQARAVVSSGYADDPVMADYEHYGFDGAIAKPYRVATLSRVLNRLQAASSVGV